MNWATFLASLAAPIAKRAFIALGLTVVSYVGISTSLESVLGLAKNNLATLDGGIASMLALSGIFDGLSILAGSLLARASLIPLKRFLPA